MFHSSLAFNTGNVIAQFGTAASPSQVMHAVYFLEEGTFVSASRIDRLLLSNADGVAVRQDGPLGPYR